MERTVKLPNQTAVSALGQGTWLLGERNSTRIQEIEALRAGIDAGMTLLDTAEMYGSGKAEALIGEAIQGYDRNSLFLVSKCYPQNAGRKNIFKSCMASMQRMKTDYIDLYLLHWRGGIPLSETVECMEQLKKEGKIRHWGVSNFDTDDMEELWRVPKGDHCAVNQVLYHIASRGIEFDLLPWLRQRGVPVMAYCPLAQAGDLQQGLYDNPILKKIAAAHNCSISQVLLAFVMRQKDIIAIPRSSKKEHTLDNAGASKIVLTNAEISMLDQAYPAPNRKVYLDII